MSGDRTTPRFDVVATTRRSWSKSQKQAIVAEIDIGGATLSEVARRHGIHASLLFRWRRDLGLPLGAPPIDVGHAGATLPQPSFMPVMLSAPTPPAAGIACKPGTIEIMLVGGRTVRVGNDFDTTVLVRIIDALENRR